MNLLALDTSTERAAIGLSVAIGRRCSRRRPRLRRRHGRDLIPRLAATLREAGLSLRDIDVIAVGLGPGSYTGLRVG